MSPSYGRPASEADWSAVRELCCRAADSGRGIARERWPFFAEYWIGPYQALLPEWAYVARREGAVVGYLTGCPDTAVFERRRRRQRAALAARVLLGRYGASEDALRFLRRALRVESDPEALLPRGSREELRAAYPAHLHVNVDEAERGRGVGARLVELFCGDLRRAGVPGVHVLCGEAPLGFYLRLGFRELARAEVRPGARVLALGMRL